MTGDRDPGLFGPGSVTWRVHLEPILLVAGLRALYLQTLHPVAVAGLTQNSGYRRDPWGRLLRTTYYVSTVVSGTTAEAEAAAARVRAIHRRLRARHPETGELFRVDEPHLLRWVHVTEVESFLTTATRAGLVLTPEERDRYYAEQVRAAQLVGLDPATVPASVAEVAAYYAEIRPELALTRDAIEAARFLAVPPMPYRLGLTPVRLAFSAVTGLAFGLLPPWARRMYGLPGLPTTDLSASLSARALRRVMSWIPESAYERYRDTVARSVRQAPAVSA
jgi:uncharacterized protein (DUF2236 family)